MRQLTRHRSAALVAVAALAMVAAACIPPAEPTPTSTTSTTGAPSTVRTVTNASFEWTISREANNGAFAPGEVNYWSAGESDSTAATYVATNGNATVLKQNASGTFAPIGSATELSYANRNRDGAGNLVTAFNDFYLGQKVRYSNGTGTVDTATGAATIQWTGTFTVNFYGKYVPFWIIDPKLTVDSDGNGTLTADLGGFASDINDPDVRVELPETADVVLAELPDVYGSGSITTGFASAQPSYLGTAVTTPPSGTAQVAQNPSNTAFWGSWPQSFVDFQQDTGLGSYWYTSGGAADSKKVQEPISVSYTLNP